MKLLLRIFLLSIILFFLSNNILSQEIVITGKQVKLNGNIQYAGKSVYVSNVCKIGNFIGTKTSFSLRIGNYNKYQFYYKNGKFSPSLESVSIYPGMYTLYPDLPEKKDSIFVKIILFPL